MENDSRWLRERGADARRPLVAAIVLGELSGIFLILQTALLAAIGNAAIMEGRRVRELAPYFAALALAIAFRFLTAWRSRRSAFACASVVRRKVRGELIRGLRDIGPIALARMRTGQIAEVATGAVDALEGYYAGYLPQRAVATLMPFTVLAVVFPLDWISGLVLALTAVFLPLSMIVIGEEAHERNRRLWTTLARISGRFLDALRGLATVKAFGAARREAEEIERASDDYRLATMSVLRIAFLSSFMLEFITAVSIAIVAVVTGLRLLSGGMRFGPGYFILLVAPEYFLTLRTLGAQYHARMGAAAAAAQIRELSAEMSEADGRGGSASEGPADVPADVPAVAATGSEPALAAAGGASAAGRPAGGDAGPRHGAALRFESVGFAYRDRPLLENLSFSVEPGEHLALLGPSGSGKSTILALLLGFAAPRSGNIALDGRNLALIDRRALYEELAWLPQRPTIFHGTIGSNIALGRPGATEGEVAEAARAAHVDEFAGSLGSGLDTLVGEGGRGLSVGQSQRVALARLFLRSPRLILLDEPTAHLDAESAEFVNDSIAALAAGRTMVLATHRRGVEVDRSLVLAEAAAEAAPRGETDGETDGEGGQA